MIAAPTRRNIGDFRQRYQNSIGWLNWKGKKTVVKIQAVGDSGVDFVDAQQFKYRVLIDKPIEFEFVPVTRGFFSDADGNLYYLTRIPARMWHRGIHQANTALYKVNIQSWEPLPIEIGTIAAILENTKHYKFQPPCCALSRAFALVDGSVYFFDELIGTFKDNQITLKNTTVAQEINDCINRNGYPIQMTAK